MKSEQLLIVIIAIAVASSLIVALSILASGANGSMMGGGMMGGHGYADCPYGQEYHQEYCMNGSYAGTNDITCPHMDSDDFGLNNTAHPCMS